MDINIKTLFKGTGNFDVFDNFPDAVIVINYQKNITFWNKSAREMFGFTKREVLGRSIGIIFTDEADQIYKNLTDNKSSILCARTKLNQELFVEITCVDSEFREETIISARDVTKNQKIIEKLLLKYEEASKISQNKSSFIASLSHELRTPMHSIIGFSQALLDGLGGTLSEKQEKYISIVSRNANGLLALLNSILDLSKIEAGKMDFNFKTFDVVHLINTVAETINPLVEEKKLDFSMDLSDIVKKNIFSEENMLRQVLLNVLTNAVKFTESGCISLKVVHPDLEFVKLQGIDVPGEYTDKSFLLFSVSDTGIGIAEEDINNIFDEYRQFDRSISKKFGGTGLGLAICKKILNELDGIIWAESELGQGATFSFIIPVEKPQNSEEFTQLKEY